MCECLGVCVRENICVLFEYMCQCICALLILLCCYAVSCLQLQLIVVCTCLTSLQWMNRQIRWPWFLSSLKTTIRVEISEDVYYRKRFTEGKWSTNAFLTQKCCPDNTTQSRIEWRYLRSMFICKVAQRDDIIALFRPMTCMSIVPLCVWVLQSDWQWYSNVWSVVPSTH